MSPESHRDQALWRALLRNRDLGQMIKFSTARAVDERCNFRAREVEGPPIGELGVAECDAVTCISQFDAVATRQARSSFLPDELVLSLGVDLHGWIPPGCLARRREA